jgi:hypothetical protein
VSRNIRAELGDDDSITFEDVEVKVATEKAMLCVIGDDEVWIPRSQVIDDGTDVSAAGDAGTLVVTKWIATEKGLV